MGWVFLSHVLTPETPGYGGKQGFWTEKATSIADGCSSNSSTWRLSNHIGTHVDAPYHFAESGAKVDEYVAGDWVFEHPQLIDIQVKPAELIVAGPWVNAISKETDLLLLRTGFEELRDKADYWEQGPGLAPEFGQWLRTEHPHVRAIGFDFLSTTSWQRRPEGRAAHRGLLDPAEPGNPVVIVEDMALRLLKTSPRRVILAPMRVAAADGAPCTALAKVS
jgi:kynurenine formamidase